MHTDRSVCMCIQNTAFLVFFPKILAPPEGAVSLLKNV
jgi:hypothetical protein